MSHKVRLVLVEHRNGETEWLCARQEADILERDTPLIWMAPDTQCGGYFKLDEASVRESHEVVVANAATAQP